MLMPSPNHGKQRMPNDDDDDDLTERYYLSQFYSNKNHKSCLDTSYFQN